MDIKVAQIDSDTGKVTFTFGMGTPEFVTGINKLAQIAMVKLLKSTGRDVLDPEKGGGLLGLIGGNINPDDTSEITADIAPRIKKVELEMLDEQLNVDLPAEERLQRLNLSTVSVDPDDVTGYNLEVELISEADELLTLNVNTALFAGG